MTPTLRILLTADPELPVPPRLYGGIERIIDLLVRAYRDRGHTVGLVAHADSTTPADELFPWPGRASQRAGDIPRNAWALHRAVARFRPGIVHSFSRLLYLYPLLAGSRPLVMSYQREPGARNVARIRAFDIRRRLSFTGCSGYIAENGRRGGGRWDAVHNCIDPSVYTPVGDVPADAPLVFLSRIEQIKGTHVAIEAARRAGRRLVIAGNHGEDGEAGRYWRERIEPELGRDGIEYIGPVDDREKNTLLGGAAAMVVPIQWNEPFGIVFIEALATGTPVISSPRGALPEIVQDGVHGFLPGDLDGVVSAIGRIGTIDRRACRRRAETAFSADAIADRYLALYRERLGS